MTAVWFLVGAVLGALGGWFVYPIDRLHAMMHDGMHMVTVVAIRRGVISENQAAAIHRIIDSFDVSEVENS